MEKEATGKLITAYVVCESETIVGVFCTRLQAFGFIEDQCQSGYIQVRGAFLFDDSQRVCLLDQNPPFEFITDYPEPKQVRAKKALKAQALAKLSKEEREALGV